MPGSFFVPGQARGGPGTPSNPPTQIAGGSSARSLPAHAGAPISRRQPPPPLSCCPPVSCHSARHGPGAAAALPPRHGGLGAQRPTGSRHRPHFGGFFRAGRDLQEQGECPLAVVVPTLGLPHAAGGPWGAPFLTPLLLPDGFPGWFPRELEGLGGMGITKKMVRSEGCQKAAPGWFGRCGSSSCPGGSRCPSVSPVCPAEGGTVCSFTGRWEMSRLRWARAEIAQGLARSTWHRVPESADVPRSGLGTDLLQPGPGALPDRTRARGCGMGAGSDPRWGRGCRTGRGKGRHCPPSRV